MVTIKDISKRCNVSPATVSKALNGYEDISKETIELVKRTAQEDALYAKCSSKTVEDEYFT